MYVILTSKPGQFRTEAGDGLQVLETYDYAFYGRTIAHFVIAELLHPVKVKVIDEAIPETVNYVPSKFLESFGSLDAAREELTRLATFGTMDIVLTRR